MVPLLRLKLLHQRPHQHLLQRLLHHLLPLRPPLHLLHPHLHLHQLLPHHRQLPPR